jgi:hypothetical protein
VPVGVFEPLVATVAVNVTDDPYIDGLAPETTVVVVVASIALTVWISVADVLPASLASPPYAAVIECCPIDRFDVA